jgi:hypothetical protein
MKCQYVQMPGGGTAIVCSSGRRAKCKCGRSATLLCDWKTPKGKKMTCDKPICDRCTTKPAPDKDLCPTHAQAYAEWKRQKTLL